MTHCNDNHDRLHSSSNKIQALWKGYKCRQKLRKDTIKLFEEIVREIEGHVAAVNWAETSMCIPKPKVINPSIE